MKEIIKINDELNFIDSTKKNHTEFEIAIKFDNSKELIQDKFQFDFYNSEGVGINEILINNWRITKISSFNYFERAKIKIEVVDPDGEILDCELFTSGGFTVIENDAINQVRFCLSKLLFKVRKYSLFMNYKSRLEYENLIKKNKVDEHFYRLYN